MRRALSFLTPFFGATEPSPTAVLWFPIAGALIGAVVGGSWWLLHAVLPAPVAAVLVVGVDLAVTGMLHLDGLVDTADGLLPHLDRERRLAVMAEPTAGAYGIGVAVVALGLRAAALAVLAPSALLVAGLWCASRTLMAWTMTRVPYARGEGLASAFLGERVRPVAAEGVLSAIVLAALWKPGYGLAAVVLGLGAGLGVVALARRRLGGFTGDVLGAAGMMVETVGLVVASSWRR